MAGTNGSPKRALDRRLEENPARFDFFHAVRALECAHANRPRVGHAERLADEYVRFGQDPSLAFEPSSIGSFRDAARPGAPGRMGVNFMGLLGVNGPMPLFFTEFARRRRSRGDRTLVRFLDIFHHRMVSLMYRAWAAHQRTVGFDRPGEDRYAVYIGSLFGVGTPATRRRDVVDDVAKLYFSGRLACQTRNADGLAAILAEYFGVPVWIEPLVGRWIDVPKENITRLGEASASGTLGSSVLLGGRVWDAQTRFRIIMGPMRFADYTRLLPSGTSLGRLKTWVRNYVGDELSWDVQLQLSAADVPRTQLGRVGELGWSTWLHARPGSADRGDLILEGAGL
jgi:type VI secretion system protein ImpH